MNSSASPDHTNNSSTLIDIFCRRHLAKIELPKSPPALSSTTPLYTPPDWHNLSYFESDYSVKAPIYNSEPISEYVEQKSSPSLKPLYLDDDSINISPITPSIDEYVTLNSIDTFSSFDSTYFEHPNCELTPSHDSSSSFDFIEQKSSPSSNLDESATLNILDSFSSSNFHVLNCEATLEYLEQTSSTILKSSIDDSVYRSPSHIPDIITSTISLKDDSPESLQPLSPVYFSPTQRFSPFFLPLSPVFSLDSDFKLSASGERVIKIEDTSAEVDELDPVPYSIALPVVQSTSQPASNTSPI
ncbi:hypothetical protein O181_108021 [Austropuccinia psidii MF-1]|uniref:Uncharacterized protein n=1 Tax=Austropuccinia psidii MF-1 TaxID=1389203 RepID=A0A9Q3JU00_9BASI|nr:hypothetical protein [Austropuccinia psidii MF-1]